MDSGYTLDLPALLTVFYWEGSQFSKYFAYNNRRSFLQRAPNIGFLFATSHLLNITYVSSCISQGGTLKNLNYR